MVRGFPCQSIHHRINPLVISGRPETLDQIIYVKLPAGKYGEKIGGLQKVWKQVLPDEAFEHWFLSEEFA